MKLIHNVCAVFIILCILLTAGCNTIGVNPDNSKVTFLTKDCGEFTFQRHNVITFLKTQKDKNPKAAQLFDILSKKQSDSFVKLSCNEYCPILFNEMLSAENDFTIRCKNCDITVPFDIIKGKFASTSHKEIQYIDKKDHVLITIRLEK